MKRTRDEQMLRKKYEEEDTNFSITDRQKRKNKKKWKKSMSKTSRNQHKDDLDDLLSEDR